MTIAHLRHEVAIIATHRRRTTHYLDSGTESEPESEVCWLSQPGTMMAAADTFHLTVRGRGGHGAMPHLSTDPVVAAAAVITALQPLVSRETSATDGAVVTVATINTGARA